jgi:hypothetical protein
MRVVFLDMDGVLLTMRQHLSVGDKGMWRHLDRTGVGLLNRLCMTALRGRRQDTGVRVVVSSTLRKEHSRDSFQAMLEGGGFRGLLHEDWRTIDTLRSWRGDEVWEWLTRHPEVERYVILDDDSDFYPGQPFVKTNPYNGMMMEHWDLAMSLLHPDRHRPILAGTVAVDTAAWAQNATV